MVKNGKICTSKTRDDFRGRTLTTLTTFLIHRNDRRSIGIDGSPINLLDQSGSTDRPSTSSINRDRRIAHQPPRSIGIDGSAINLLDRNRRIGHQPPRSESTDRPSTSSIGIDRSAINLLDRNRPIGHQPPRSESSFLNSRVFFSQSCPTRCDGRSDG